MRPSFMILIAIGTALAGVGATPGYASAQTEAVLRNHFEGQVVALKIDMPGTSDGVDVAVGRAFDSRAYGDRLKRFGIAHKAGDRVTVTLVKVKRDLIEFQLNGGGYGTLSDDTSTSVSLPPMDKSRRERDLERLVRDENDPVRRRELQRELDDVRQARERENRRIEAQRRVMEDFRAQTLAARRREGGTRFNLRYANNVPAGITPADVELALAQFVEFSPADQAEPLPVRASGWWPRPGMARGEIEEFFGKPVETRERREGALTMRTLIFLRDGARVTADFVEDVMIRYSVTNSGDAR